MRHKTFSGVLALGAALLALPVGAQAPAPAPASPATAAPAPAPKPYEDIIKLWRANLSEDFIKRQIETGTTVYDLSADEMIRCRDAGIPEGLIQVMIATKNPRTAPEKPAPASAGASAAAPVAPPAAGTAPAAAPAAPRVPSLAAEADRSWEGLARRNSGLVLFKGRWDVGTLHFKEELFRWVDARDPGKNLLFPASQISEQFLTCLKKPGGNECFEWGFRTKDGEYRFRDVSWEQGENRKAQEIFDFFKAIYPSLVSSEVPVDSKELGAQHL